MSTLAYRGTRGAVLLAMSVISAATFYSAPSLAANTQPPSQASVAACPAQDFDGFLKRFANDIEVQKAFVSTPLQSEYIDPEAQPEPRPVSELLDRSQLQFPLMPSYQQQHDQGLTLVKQLKGPDQAVIKLSKADTGYQLSLFFKREACWMLYRIQDESL
ncbi:hypothetical protein AB7M18_000911 [Pseudomonas viridiflava]|uniref:hypothetical protein n=1 Tax=Pseudomonas syringae TaxID=317 RepID=UPI000BB5D4F9|nr:hypothetical protein [Pseudomonas syringae]PBP84091.1 hypothetical protein CCL22_08820 [Pseudomonas syringae]